MFVATCAISPVKFKMSTESSARPGFSDNINTQSYLNSYVALVQVHGHIRLLAVYSLAGSLFACYCALPPCWQRALAGGTHAWASRDPCSHQVAAALLTHRFA